jgi:hypothetical protein
MRAALVRRSGNARISFAVKIGVLVVWYTYYSTVQYFLHLRSVTEGPCHPNLKSDVDKVYRTVQVH